MILGVLGMVQSGLDVGSIVGLAGILMPFAALFVIVQVSRSPRDTRFLLWAIALSSVVPMAFGMLDVVTGQSFLGTANELFLAGGQDAAGQPTLRVAGVALWRITATFDGTANFARFCVFAFAATVGLMPSSSLCGRFVLLALAAAQLFVIANTFTRSAYVAAALVAVMRILFLDAAAASLRVDPREHSHRRSHPPRATYHRAPVSFTPVIHKRQRAVRSVGECRRGRVRQAGVRLRLRQRRRRDR